MRTSDSNSEVKKNCYPQIGNLSSLQQKIKTNGSLVRSDSGSNEFNSQDKIPALTQCHKSNHTDDQSCLSRQETLFSDFEIPFSGNSSPLDDELINDLNQNDSAIFCENEGEQSSSSPLLLSECPEFMPYLDSSENNSDSNKDYNTDNEIIYGFPTREKQKLEINDDVKRKDILELRIESNKDTFVSAHKIDSGMHSISPSKSIRTSFQRSNSCHNNIHPSKHSRPGSTYVGLEALMNCAADELDRLRVGAANSVLRRSEVSNADTVVNSNVNRIKTPVVRDERANSTTGTLTSLVQIQLAQLDRIVEKVKSEHSNKLAHEKALLELLELEHDRIKHELSNAETNGSPSSDLVNQLRHLSLRLEQQTSLIDEIEYEYLEEKTTFEEERECLISQLRIDTESPVSNTNSGTPYTRPSSPNSEQTLGYNDFGYSINNGLRHLNESKSFLVEKNSSLFNNKSTLSNESFQPVYLNSSSQEYNNVENVGSCDSVVCTSSDVSNDYSKCVNSSAPSQPTTNGNTLFLSKHNENYTDSAQPSASNSTDEKLSSDSPSCLSSNPRSNGNEVSSSDSSLQPTKENLPQSNSLNGQGGSSSFAYHKSTFALPSEVQIFHAVPPLPHILHFPFPGHDAIVTTTGTIASCTAPNNSTIMRRRTFSTGVSNTAHTRPLTRSLPVPDDVSFDLKNHLEAICGHTLYSPILKSQIFVEVTRCSGFLFKMDSMINQFVLPSDMDAFASPTISRRNPNSGLGGSNKVMGSALNFFRLRPRRKRWFVLDRQRRLFAYYNIHNSKSAVTMNKPKDVISFTDIIDVYPNHQVRGKHEMHGNSASRFCILLLANSTAKQPSTQDSFGSRTHSNDRQYPMHTRLLSLAADSPEAMRVWVDALFTCAGAYLCLPSINQKTFCPL